MVEPRAQYRLPEFLRPLKLNCEERPKPQGVPLAELEAERDVPLLE